MYEMIDMHSKYDNMHTNGLFYALICINDNIFSYIIYMLSINFLNFNQNIGSDIQNIEVPRIDDSIIYYV